MKKWRLELCLLWIVIMGYNVSCTTVKPYQKQYLNDYYMQTGPLPEEKLDAEADTYREGASGGMGGKSGGGCGCN